jgi:catalase
MTPPEQRHIVSAFTFELSKVETISIRTRMLGHLKVIEPGLHDRVAAAMGMQGMADEIRPAVPPRDLPPSPALSLLGRAPETLHGRKVGVLLGDGFDRELVAGLAAALEKQQAMIELVALKIGGARAADGTVVPADHIIGGGPSVIFDAVAVIAGAAGVAGLAADPAALAWVGDAFLHGKVIGAVSDARPLLDAARVAAGDGVIDLGSGLGSGLGGGDAIPRFISAAKRGRIWSREVAAQQSDKPATRR